MLSTWACSYHISTKNWFMRFRDGSRNIEFVYERVSLPVTQKIPPQNTHHNRVLVHMMMQKYIVNHAGTLF